MNIGKEERTVTNNVEILIEKIEKVAENGRYVFGIDGLGRAGKTTTSEKLIQHLEQKKIPFYLFHIDDHIVERKKRYDTGEEEWKEYYYLQWDIAWLSQHFFEKIKSRNSFLLPFYNKELDTHTLQEINLPEDCFIIIEGVFLQRKERRDFYDYVVYLECPQPERFLRESESTQGNISKLENRYWKAEAYYVETEAPQRKADLVLKG